MSNLPSKDGARGIVTEPFSGPTEDLTRQQVEEGLDKLVTLLLRPPLPFIILIEDDEDESFLFRSALERAGVAVDFMYFKDGRQASDFFQGRGGFSDREMYPLPQPDRVKL